MIYLILSMERMADFKTLPRDKWPAFGGLAYNWEVAKMILNTCVSEDPTRLWFIQTEEKAD